MLSIMRISLLSFVYAGHKFTSISVVEALRYPYVTCTLHVFIDQHAFEGVVTFFLWPALTLPQAFLECSDNVAE